VGDTCLLLREGQAAWRQPDVQALEDLLGILLALAEDDEVSGREESHLPALVEPGVNLSAHPAPIVQPSGRTPSFQ
jgi:hypothetical protein